MCFLTASFEARTARLPDCFIRYYTNAGQEALDVIAALHVLSHGALRAEKATKKARQNADNLVAYRSPFLILEAIDCHERQAYGKADFKHHVWDDAAVVPKDDLCKLGAEEENGGDATPLYVVFFSTLCAALMPHISKSCLSKDLSDLLIVLDLLLSTRSGWLLLQRASSRTTS